MVNYCMRVREKYRRLFCFALPEDERERDVSVRAAILWLSWPLDRLAFDVLELSFFLSSPRNVYKVRTNDQISYIYTQ